MRVNNKTIVITDPCYVSKEDNWGSEFDWEDNTISLPEFTEYLWIESGWGDGSQEVREFSDEIYPQKYIDQLADAFDREDNDEISELFDLGKYLGEFGMDSGNMGVMILDEVKNYNPDCFKDLPENCYCIIEDFSGEISYLTDFKGYNHIVLTSPTNESYIITI